MEIELTIRCEDRDEVQEVVGILNEAGMGPDHVEVAEQRLLSEMPIGAYKRDEEGFKLLRTDPDDIRFTEKPSALQGTDKQQKILATTLDNRDASIARVAQLAGASESYTKKILGSATLADARDLAAGIWDMESDETEKTPIYSEGDDDEEDDWGVVGSADVEEESVTREFREPDTDTRQYEVLTSLMERAPAKVSDIEADPKIDAEVNVGAELYRLFKMKLVERTKRATYDDDYQYYVTSLGEFLLQRRDDWRENGKNGDYKNNYGDITRRDVDEPIEAGD